MNQCPKCGSIMGYTKVKILKSIELFNYSGEVYGVHGITLRENTFVRCFECKKLFKLKK